MSTFASDLLQEAQIHLWSERAFHAESYEEEEDDNKSVPIGEINGLRNTGSLFQLL